MCCKRLYRWTQNEFPFAYRLLLQKADKVRPEKCDLIVMSTPTKKCFGIDIKLKSLNQKFSNRWKQTFQSYVIRLFFTRKLQITNSFASYFLNRPNFPSFNSILFRFLRQRTIRIFKESNVPLISSLPWKKAFEWRIFEVFVTLLLKKPINIRRCKEKKFSIGKNALTITPNHF